MDLYYKPFFVELQKAEISYVLCGGLAIILHGYRRFTSDIDVAVSFKTENIQSFVEVMEKLGYKPRAPVPAMELIDPEKRREWREEKNARVFTFFDPSHPYRQIDTFIEEVIPFEDLLAASILKEDSDLKIRIASIEHLLKMKRNIQPPRPHDELDIIMLEKMLQERK